MKNAKSFNTLLHEKDITFSFREKVSGDIVMEQYRSHIIMDSFRKKNEDFLIMESYKNFVEEEKAINEDLTNISNICNRLKEEKTSDLLNEFSATTQSMTKKILSSNSINNK